MEAALGKAAQSFWMDPGGNGGCFHTLAWDMLVAGGHGSSDLFQLPSALGSHSLKYLSP